MKKEILNAIVRTLIEKNKRYGNAALRPIHYFYKGSATHSIEIRLDDKISRIVNSDVPRKNDVYDILGYLFLYCISNDFFGLEDFKTFEAQVDAVRSILSIKVDAEYEKIEKEGDILKTFNEALLQIRDNEPSTDNVLYLMTVIVSYFMINGIADFSDLID